MEGETTQRPLTEIESAPRCPKCGYVLIGLTEHRCPECGSAFDPAIVEQAGLQAALLPWERPEKWGVVSRLLRTFAQASFRPGRYFANASQRRDLRIAGAGTLLFGLVIVAACMHVGGLLIYGLMYFLKALFDGSSVTNSADRVYRLLSASWSADAHLMVLQVMVLLMAVIAMAALMRPMFRVRLRSHRTLDLAALLSPAVAFGAMIFVVAGRVPLFFAGSMTGSVYVVVLGQPAVLMTLVWFACRRMLFLDAIKSIGTVIMCGVALCISYLVVSIVQVFLITLS